MLRLERRPVGRDVAERSEAESRPTVPERKAEHAGQRVG